MLNPIANVHDWSGLQTLGSQNKMRCYALDTQVSSRAITTTTSGLLGHDFNPMYDIFGIETKIMNRLERFTADNIRSDVLKCAVSA